MAPRRVNYIAFSGGGESLSAILGGQVSVGINGLAEFAPADRGGHGAGAGDLERRAAPGLDMPTLREQGVDVEFENWRSRRRAAGHQREDRRRLDSARSDDGASAEWREALARYRWLDRYLAGDAFDRFVDAEEARVRDDPAASSGPAATTPDRSSPPARIRCSSRRAGDARRGCRGPRADGVADREPRLTPRQPVASDGAGLAAGIASAICCWPSAAGFVIASAVLFWFAARAFDPRHPLATRCSRVISLARPAFARVLSCRCRRVLALVVASARAGWSDPGGVYA